jgi:hypothetical protein
MSFVSMNRRRWASVLTLTVGAMVLAGFQIQAAGPTKYHVVINGGPNKGTYDVTGEECMAGVQKKGSWHATWEDQAAPQGKLAAILVGYDPKPTFGSGYTASVHFGPPDVQLLYEILKPTFNVVDRGSTATLTFKGDARTSSYVDGSQAQVGPLEITIECGKILRADQ